LDGKREGNGRRRREGPIGSGGWEEGGPEAWEEGREMGGREARDGGMGEEGEGKEGRERVIGRAALSHDQI
jgi:hypothetical protein